jgi:hypothetical protein
MSIRVGFWNIERAGTRNIDRLASVIGVCQAWWMHQKPNLVVMAEVPSEGGRDFANEIWWEKKGFQTKFIPVSNKKGRVSVCSFLIAWRPFSIEITYETVGVSVVRPMIQIEAKVEKRAVTIAACHVKANEEKSIEDFQDMMNDLVAQQRSPAIVIGDMNHKFENAPGRIGAFRKVGPGFSPTFISHRLRKDGTKVERVFDYAWTDSLGLTPEQPPTYEEWDVIDHAPIQYRIDF